MQLREALLALHAAMMFLAWAVVAPAGFYVARYGRHLPRWLFLHRILMTSVFAMTMLALSAALYVMDPTLVSVHQIIDFVVAVLATAQFGVGCMIYHRCCVNERIRGFGRGAHVVLGPLTIALGLTNISLVMFDCGVTDRNVWLAWSVWVMFLVAAATILERRKQRQLPADE